MVSQLMRAEKLCLALETSVSIRTKSSKLKEASLFRESQSAFHTCDKISEMKNGLIPGLGLLERYPWYMLLLKPC